MRIMAKRKALLSTLVFLLIITPHACFVEQAVASLAELLPHSHEAGGHHADSDAKPEKTAPSHCHDEAGNEAEFCCDNAAYFYIGSDHHPDVKCLSAPERPVALTLLETEDAFKARVEYYTYLHRLRQPVSLRGRDRYALSCLLHAPPFSYHL